MTDLDRRCYAKFDGLLNGRVQPRTQEKGLPYFRAVEIPKPTIVETPAQPKRDWLFCQILFVAVGIVVAATVGIPLFWMLMNKLGR